MNMEKITGEITEVIGNMNNTVKVMNDQLPIVGADAMQLAAAIITNLKDNLATLAGIVNRMNQDVAETMEIVQD